MYWCTVSSLLIKGVCELAWNVLIRHSFAYLELYLSVSQILRNFHLRLPNSGGSTESQQAVLPERLEWVAAIPVAPMDIVFFSREDSIATSAI